ncbi:MAG: 2-oxo acid dehydrogenase subunit E2 [Saprospiraceae bacterium]|jgi:2-oxoglutarate dehydrogenase E2 component (dihydrolipoamide succinyltransferase)|nr:2-oxo acid dehydrogenase subunit E2 [Saprospiraceae bacterium]MBP9210974.1 2-oxo acid dehydrogenase subunit E2 [Saprospiraceae bacterium]MBV6474431.1 Dihydrolipoyllysine-residue acetyltransferase component of pyruvate dehydrogenase complex [Saprospiraceae bacterium]
MSRHELVLPKMGESIVEATLLKWLKKEGDRVAQDESVLEIATDKVDSEVPSPVSGTLVSILHREDEVVAIGKAVAIIETGEPAGVSPAAVERENMGRPAEPAGTVQPEKNMVPVRTEPSKSEGKRFYSPLVRNIARQEKVSEVELDQIAGTGQEGRVTKRDILEYLAHNRQPSAPEPPLVRPPESVKEKPKAAPVYTPPGTGVEIIEMDRMRKLIADHMVMSKQTSPHVTSFVEIDVTPIVKWRDRVKDDFAKKYSTRLTFTPLFIQAIARAIVDFPMINVSVQGTQILRKYDINIGMATALPGGNLIVPVIRNADRLNLAGLSFAVNDLSERARSNKLKPEDIQDGTFTLTNVGSFGNIMGTPIINQPQVAILATGVIQKKPAVIETESGDLIGIRHMMFLSLSYDHRIVDGALGGAFLRKVGDYLEQFDVTQNL